MNEKNDNEFVKKKRVLVSTSSFGIPLNSTWVEQITEPNIEVVFNRNCSEQSTLPSRGLSMSPRLRAKIEKMVVWETNPDYDYYVWMDSSFSILRNDSIQWIVNQCTDDVDAVFFKHSERNSIKVETELVVNNIGCDYFKTRYVDEPLLEQLNFYLNDENFNDNFLIEAGLFIYKKKIVENKDYNVMKEWFYNNCLWSVQDQISLPYVLQKFNIKFKFFDTTIYNNPYFKFTFKGF